MSLLNKASLILIPSGYKEDTLYSAKPINGDGDLTFSRASTATRVNSEGLIEKARTNFLLQSNDFSNAAWSKLQSGGTTPVVTSGFSDPNGGSNAWRLECSITGGAFSIIQQSLSSLTTIGIASIYIKSNTGSNQDVYIRLDSNDSSTTRTATTEWTRIDVFTTASAKTFSIGVRNNATGATSSCDVLIYAAQAETGDIATEYIETTTAAVSVGMTANVPRLDYSGGGCPKLLLEPQTTALNQFSESFDNAYWIKNDVTIVANTTDTIDPSGYNGADKVVETATSARHRVSAGTATISAANHTASVFMKKGTARYGFVTFSGAAVSTIVVDLENGTITDTSTSGTIVAQKVDDYGNGWYRISVTALGIVATTTYTLQFGSAGSATPSYTANIPSFSGSTSNYLYAWGANLTATSYPTSYIPTLAAAVTRGADACFKTGISSLIGQTEGTMFIEFEQDYTSAVNGFASLSDGSSTNRITVNTLGVSLTEFGFSIAMNYSGSGTVIMDSDITYNDRHKAVVVYSGTTAKLFIDGSQVDTNTTTGFGNYDRFILGQNQLGGSVQEQREFYNAVLFPIALTDAECIELTTL